MAISRRKLVKRTAWSAFGLATLSIPVRLGREAHRLWNDPCDVSVDSSLREKLEQTPFESVESFYKNAYGYRPYTLIGNTNHSDFGINPFFYSPGNITDMLQGNIRHVFLEMDTRLDDLIDQLIQRDISESEFKRKRGKRPWLRTEDSIKLNDLVSEAIISLHEQGIEAHASDIKKIFLRDDLDLYWGNIKRLVKYAHDTCPNSKAINGSITASYSLKKMFGGFSAFSEKEEQVIPEKREARGDDRQRLKHIESIAQGANSVIFYGAGHFDEDPLSMRTLLGEKSLLINLYSTRDLYLDLYSLQHTKKPDFVHIIDEGIVFQTGDLTFQELSQNRRPTAPVVKSTFRQP